MCRITFIYKLLVIIFLNFSAQNIILASGNFVDTHDSSDQGSAITTYTVDDLYRFTEAARRTKQLNLSPKSEQIFKQLPLPVQEKFIWSDLIDKTIEMGTPSHPQTVRLLDFFLNNFEILVPSKYEINKLDRETLQTSFRPEYRKLKIGLAMAQAGAVEIIGDPGVGKSEFLDIALKYLIREIKNSIIIQFKASDIMGQSSLVSDYQNRRDLISQVSSVVPIIFIADEAHGLTSVGRYGGNEHNFFQGIKDRMARGLIKFIFATTPGESKHLHSDQALSSRIQTQITIKEKTEEETIEAVQIFISRNFPHYKNIDPNVLLQIVRTATRFSPLNANPRKSIMLIDYILSAANESETESFNIDSRFIQNLASEFYGYNISSISSEKLLDLVKEMSMHLNEIHVGNEEAKKNLEHFIFGYLESIYIGNVTRPYSGIISGPEGSGKSTLGNAIATSLHLDFTRIHVSKYLSKGFEAIENFKRDLYLEVKKNPFRIIFIEGFDGLNPSIQDAFQNIINEGRFEVEFSSGSVLVDISKTLFLISLETPELNAPIIDPRQTLMNDARTKNISLNLSVIKRIDFIVHLERPPENLYHDVIIKIWNRHLDELTRRIDRIIISDDDVIRLVRHKLSQNRLHFPPGFINTSQSYSLSKTPLTTIETQILGLIREIRYEIALAKQSHNSHQDTPIHIELDPDGNRFINFIESQSNSKNLCFKLFNSYR